MGKMMEIKWKTKERNKKVLKDIRTWRALNTRRERKKTDICHHHPLLLLLISLPLSPSPSKGKLCVLQSVVFPSCFFLQHSTPFPSLSPCQPFLFFLHSSSFLYYSPSFLSSSPSFLSSSPSFLYYSSPNRSYYILI